MSKKASLRWQRSTANDRILLFESEPILWAVDIDTPKYSDYLWFRDKDSSDTGLPLHELEALIAKERQP